MKKFFSFVCALVLVLSATATPQFTVKNQDLSAMKAGMETKKIDVESFAAIKAPKASKAHLTRLLTNDEVSGITFAECAYYPTDSVWELMTFDADTNLVSIFMFKNSETNKIAGNYVADANKKAAIQHVAAVGDTVLLQGAFAIAYDSEGENSSKYHVSATGLVDTLNRSFDYDFIVEVAAYNAEAYQMYRLAYQYALYYYQQYMTTQSEEDYNALMYYSQMMQYYGNMIDIDLLDAPVVPTGDTIALVIDDLTMTDKQATAGWWQILGYSADSAVFVTLSNLTDTTRATAIGTYTNDDLDYSYSYISADGETIHFEEGTVVVSMNEDGSYHVAATLLGRDGNVFVMTLNSFAMSNNVITMSFANDTLLVSTTNDDPYFFVIETKDEYDSYESDFSQASLNEETESWINVMVEQGYLSYYTYSGDILVNVAEYFGETPTGDYVALVAPIYGTIRNGDASYLLFHYVKVVSEFMLTDNLNWGTAYVYAWDANGGEPYGAWPGTLVTETVVNNMQETQFVIGVPDVAVGIVVNNGSGAQTVDITDFNYEGYWMDGTQDGQGHYNVIGYGEHSTAVQNVEAAGKVVKALRNGQLIIRRNGVEFDVIGARLK